MKAWSGGATVTSGEKGGDRSPAEIPAIYLMYTILRMKLKEGLLFKEG